MTDQDIIDTIAVSLHKSHLEGIISFRGEAVSAFVALRAAGYAVVKLPEPHSVTDHAAGWPGGGDKWAVSRNVGKVLADRPKALDPDEARDFAAALLAAADAAGADQ